MRWTHHGDDFTVHTDIESLCCSSKMNMKGYVNYASVKKKENGGRMISALTIAEKDEALSLASGSAVFPPLSDVKDTYGLGRSRWDRPGVPSFSQAPRKCQFLQIPGCI